MKRNVMLIYLRNRKDVAEKVQKILTGWGCLIKTRLGIHDDVLDNCTDTGLIFLELVGDTEKHRELKHKLELLKDVDVQLVELKLEN